MTTKLDADQVIIHAFDEENMRFNAKQVTGTPDNQLTKKDVNQVWKEVFDEATESLRILFV